MNRAGYLAAMAAKAAEYAAAADRCAAEHLPLENLAFFYTMLVLLRCCQLPLDVVWLSLPDGCRAVVSFSVGGIRAFAPDFLPSAPSSMPFTSGKE